MKGASYRDRDYAFGQTMLTLRTAIGLTQAGLARHLGISRKAVGEWEAGLTYPKAEHLKAFIALAVEQQAYPLGREAEEIRTFWHAAHQKVLLDEAWLGTLLPQVEVTPVSLSAEETLGVPSVLVPPAHGGPLVDWGDAPGVTTFFGREWELNLLTSWVVEERCRVVSVLGLGGIGKSALAISLMHQVAPHFEVVIWRSLRDAPSCEAVLDQCLQVLAPQSLGLVPISLERRLDLLLEHLRTKCALVVLDNLETLLEEGVDTGRMRAGYEGYGQLLRQVAQTEHQSCLLLTSREKASELLSLERSQAPVRTLRLARLDDNACEKLLAEKEVAGSATDHARLIEAYAGNPLALNIVAQTIVDLFAGETAPFLEQGAVVFGGIRELLGQQFTRLSVVEQTVLLWLAIVREPFSMEQLLALLVTPLSRAQLLEAIEALHNRSLIERGKRAGSFTLQSVVLEYATERLIAEAASEIEHGQLVRLIEHSLELAAVTEYVRQTQQRLLVVPLLAQVRTMYSGRVAVEGQLLAQLDEMRTRADYAQGYGPANLLTLLREQRGHLRGLDLSQIAIRGAFLQGVEMQDASLAEASLRETVLNESFDIPWAVAISRNGQYWAAGSRRGEVRVWREEGKLLHLAWQAHSDTVRAIAFSLDGRTLATGSLDSTIKLWDIESGTLLWTSSFTENIECVAFAPDGRTVASGGDDSTVQLWDAHTGTHLQTLSGQSGPVYALAWSPDGHLLASGDVNGDIRLWELQGAQSEPFVRRLSGHTNWVLGLAFAPDGSTLASASWDRTVKLWDVESRRVLQTLSGHTERVRAVAWSPDGHLLASCGLDHTIWVWDIERGSYRMGLHGHTARVYDIAFTPDSRSLLSGSEDGTLRVWEVERGQCVHIMQSYAVSLYDVAWSPDGRLLASSGLENAVRLWDATTGEAKQILQDPDHVNTLFFGVAWSPDGTQLASASYLQGVHVWEVTTGSHLWVGRGQSTRIRRVAWSPDGTLLASCGNDGSVCLWKASDGTMLAQFQGHRAMVMSVAWSPDGARLASGGGSRGGGELVVWDVQSGKRLQAWREPSAIVYALAWSPTGAVLLSGGGDGNIRWWDVQNGECRATREGHQGAVQSLRASPDGRRLASCGGDDTIQVWDLESSEHLRTLRRDRPYERLNITGIMGVTEAQKATLRALGAIEKAPAPGTQHAF
jgi:WD40 repeat protein/transcriptional regulator with XRE-family HTH domain